MLNVQGAQKANLKALASDYPPMKGENAFASSHVLYVQS